MRISILVVKKRFKPVLFNIILHGTDLVHKKRFYVGLMRSQYYMMYDTKSLEYCWFIYETIELCVNDFSAYHLLWFRYWFSVLFS